MLAPTLPGPLAAGSHAAAPRSPRPGRCPASARAVAAAPLIAMIRMALGGAAALVACTQTHVVLEPAPDAAAGAGDTGPGATALAISTGDGHTCAIAGGALYCWGANADGRLGVGDTSARLSPQRVGTDADWQVVATGGVSSLALKRDGTLWSFGGNADGQLGLGDLSPRASPTRVGARSDWTAIALRFFHACAIARDRSVWCWGRNGEGQLGQDDSGSTPPNRLIPTQVTTDHDFAAVDAGDGHTCAIRTDGTLWGWGRNSELELGLDGTNLPVQIRHPVQVGKATDWQVVRSGQNSTCGVRGGVALCWGRPFDHAIPGGPVDPTFVPTPTEIGGPRGLVDLSFHTFGGGALDASGGAWIWGRNEEGQLGLGDEAPHTVVVRLDASGWTQISVGHFTTCGVRGGRAVCAGSNDHGQLGQGDTSSTDIFVEVRFPQP